jgi:hypothetical protein
MYHKVADLPLLHAKRFTTTGNTPVINPADTPSRRPRSELAHALEAEAVVEELESQQLCELTRSLGVEHAQGFCCPTRTPFPV